MVDPFRSPKLPRLKCSGDDGVEDGDRFSNLPEPIIHYIFSFLETIDVVRASAVSRKWRYLWLSIPYLNFNIHTIWSNPQDRWSLSTINEKFKDFVNWVLLSQNGSIDIQRFRLWCLYYEGDYTLYRWIGAMVRRSVQVLDLDITSNAPIEFPHCLVTCKSLVSLKLDLNRCVLRLPTSAGFSRLKSIELLYVELSDFILLGNFISSCHLLENLKMKSCIFRDFKILYISSISLKNITLYEGSNGDDLSNCEVKIACPNLVSFNFLASSSPDFSFEGLNSLQNVFIFLDEIDKHERVKESCQLLSKILSGLRDIKVLKLSIAFMEFLYLVLEEPAFFSTSFSNLKSLKLFATMAEWIIPSIISFLNCSPNLEALTIYFDWEEYYDDWKILDKSIFCLTYHLKTVELIGVSGHKNELELVKFLLKNGQVLQKMSIFWWKGVENRWEIISTVMKFPRSSSSAALKFLEPRPEYEFLNI